MHTIICKNCSKEVVKKRKTTFCTKGCSTSYRQKSNDLNFMNETDDFKSYMVGMIFGDGCLSKQKEKEERITIALKDKEEIDIIRQRISPSRKLYVNKAKDKNHSNSYAVINTNKEAISELKSIGLNSNKSTYGVFPDISSLKKSAFLRGYFDANGSIYKNKVSKYLYHHVSITSGSKSFAEGLSSYLNSIGFKTKVSKDKRHNAFYIKIYSKTDVFKFKEHIYNEAEIYLNRKKVLFDDIV